jgi:hypothetical protein
VLVTYVDRCSACSCSSLRDEAGRRPVPGLGGCGESCRCHCLTTPAVKVARVGAASLAGDAGRFRFWRRSRQLISAGEHLVPVASH